MAEAILSAGPIVENATLSSAGGVELAWRYVTDNYTRFQIATYVTALVHFVSYFTICIPSLMFKYMPFMQRFKIQEDKPVTYALEWKCLKLLLVSQLVIQPPFYLGAHFYCEYMQVPFSYDEMPPWYQTLAGCFGCLVIEDAWHYWLHRTMHHKSLYKHVHKIHHTFTAPFGMIAEYAHPLETLVLGMGTMWGFLVFGNHLVFMWAWMVVRVMETIDVHSGYDIPLNPLHLFPFYGGARFHDFHHMNFTGNYAPTFTWWDKICGTDQEFKNYLEKQEAKKQK